MQTVKNKTTVLILVFKKFVQIISTTEFCTLCKRVSRYSLEKFSSHSFEKFRRGTLLCLRKFLLLKNVKDKRGGVSRFSVENFLSHSAKNFRRGTLQCFINFGYRKILCLRGEHHDFLWKICCLTVPKSFVGELFCVSQNFWYRKNFWIRGGGGEEGEEGGVSRFSVKNFLSHSAEKVRRGTLLCFTKFMVSKKFMDRRGGGRRGVGSRFSVEKFLSHSAEVFRRGTP